jgi:methyl-accepting chemotaxis protein
MENITSAGVMESSNKERRKSLWIDPGFQRRYAILLLSLVLLVSLVLVGAFWFYADQTLVVLKNLGVQPDHSLYLMMQKQMNTMLLSAGIVVALFGVFVMLAAYFLSHRIVGPIFAIKRSLELIKDNKLDQARLTLRSDDEFKDVAELINGLVDASQSKPQ